MRFTVTCFTFCLLFLCFTNANAGGEGFWKIDIPVFDNAENLIVENNDKYLSMVKSYDIKVDSPEKVRKFYSNYFESIGWKNPMEGFKQRNIGMQNGWSAYRMTFNAEGKPEAIYAVSWKAKDKPATGTLQVKLTDYSNNIFTANVEIRVSPEIDMSPLMKLNELIGNDPKNLFRLYRATKGNPFEIDSIEIICDGDLSGYDQLVKDYCNIVNQITDSFTKFAEEYKR